MKATGRAWPPPPFEQGPTHPAVNVSWDDAQAFCRWLTASERKAGTISDNEHYRLPLDREWSCAVGIGDLEPPTASPWGKHGGLPDVFLWGREWPPPSDAANFSGEECLPPPGAKTANVPVIIKGRRDPFVHTAPVGSFRPGPFGLLDLSGNVREWCEEWYHEDRQEMRVLRGGDFTLNDGDHSMSAARLGCPPALQTPSTGVRIVLGPGAGPDVKGLIDAPPPLPPATTTPKPPKPPTSAPLSYPKPSKWTDLTESFKQQVLTGSQGKFENGMIHVTKGGSFPLENNRVIGDVAVRVVLQGCVKVVLRKAHPLSYIASMELLPAGGGVRAALFQYDEARKTTSGFYSLNATLDAGFRLDADHEIVFTAVGERLCYWLDGKLVHTVEAKATMRGALALSFQEPPSLPDGFARIRKVECAVLP